MFPEPMFFQLVAVPTWYGVLLQPDEVPSPNCPLSAAPHVHNVPFVFIATQYAFPVCISFQFVAVPTCTGVDLFTNVPSPNSPTALSPHAHSVPLFLIAMVKPVPHDTSFQSLAVPTFTGVLLLVVVPFPNWPDWLFPHVHKNVDKNIEQYLEILETTRIQIAWNDVDDYKKMLKELFKAYENNNEG